MTERSHQTRIARGLAGTARTMRIRWRRHLRRFRTSERGNVAMIISISMVPLAGMMGLALDYSRVMLGHSELQAAVDSAGLAVAQLPRNTPLPVLQQRAQQWVESSLAAKGLGAVTVTVTRDASGLSFRAQTTVPTTLFSVIQRQDTPIAAGNQVVWNTGKVEIALVLDNTGSMASNNKIAALKNAATELVRVLQDAVTETGQVKIGIVPFSMTVNVGGQYRTSAWIANHQQSSLNAELFWSASGAVNPNRFDLLDKMSQSWAGCVESRPIPFDSQDTPPTTGDSVFVPFFAPDEPDGDGSAVNNYLSDDTGETDWRRQQGNVSKYKSKVNPGRKRKKRRLNQRAKSE